MAGLRDMVSEYQDDLRNGIAWLAFWRVLQYCSCSENEGPQKAQVFVGRLYRAALIISKPINTGKSLTRPLLPGRGLCLLGNIPNPLFLSGKFTIHLFP